MPATSDWGGSAQKIAPRRSATRNRAAGGTIHAAGALEKIGSFPAFSHVIIHLKVKQTIKTFIRLAPTYPTGERTSTGKELSATKLPNCPSRSASTSM